VTWYPFEAIAGSDSAAAARWGEPRSADSPALPEPIIEVLSIWREFLPEDFAATMDELEEGGYKSVPVAGSDVLPPIAESVYHTVGAALGTGEPAAVEHACQVLRGVDAAVSAARRAHDAHDVSDPRREVGAMTLGVLLSSKYSRTGELAVLDEAIELTRSATVDSTASGWMLAARLTNLGRVLNARYLRTGELDSLREAARTQRRAVLVAPSGHQDRTIYQLNLAETLCAVFDRTGDLAVLDEAFTLARDALMDVPDGPPFRISHLANLSVIHHLRYARTAEVAELDTAQALLREALAYASATHPRRPGAVVANAASKPSRRSCHAGACPSHGG
jgi:hypothetical protein